LGWPADFAGPELDFQPRFHLGFECFRAQWQAFAIAVPDGFQL
jgi:hypothetical protein